MRRGGKKYLPNSDWAVVRPAVELEARGIQDPTRRIIAPDELVDFSKIEVLPMAKYLTNKEQKFAVPIVNLLSDPDIARKIWPDYDEDFFSQIERHQEIAQKVVSFLDWYFYGRIELKTENEAEMATKKKVTKKAKGKSKAKTVARVSGSNEEDLTRAREDYYDSVSELLADPETERIVLFLPFETFPKTDDHSPSAEQFRANYLAAWYNLLYMHDVRANFVDGKVEGHGDELPRVVKAMHLVPWLIQKEMITLADVLEILHEAEDSVLVQSFFDVLPYLETLVTISDDERYQIEVMRLSYDLDTEQKELGYLAMARKSWAARKAAKRPEYFSEKVFTLGLPIATRISGLAQEIVASEMLAKKIGHGVVLLGGSRVKGYGGPDSDIDLYIVTGDDLGVESHTILWADLEDDPASNAHKALAMVAVGEPSEIKEFQKRVGKLYFEEQDSQIRRWTTEKLEQDLLEYRLMHEGYSKMCPDMNPGLKEFTAMDGGSVFYETGFRVIATKVFAQEIFVPKV